MDSSEERPKAFLVLTVLGGESVRIPVYSRPYTIGRAKSCNYSIPNKIISGQHCRVSHDEEKDCFFIEDTSTNGMLVNKTVRTTKGQKLRLKDGDEVFLVYRKQSPTDVISFQFEEVRKEVAAVNIDSTLLCEDEDVTEEYLSEVGPADEEKKRKREEDDDQDPSGEQSKKAHIAPVVDLPVSGQAVSKDMEQIVDQGSPAGDAGVSDDNPEPKSLETKEIAGVPLLSVEKAGGEQTMNESHDEMLETLICIICQDILHDCVSLQPCMHTFCAACYSQWMDKSTRCPTCRKHGQRVSKNHIVNNLVQAYLKTHPEKKRAQEDIDDMNARNKITTDTMVTTLFGEDNVSEDDEEIDSAEQEELDALALDELTAFTMTCRQCPGHIQHPLATSVIQAKPSTSAVPLAAPGAAGQRFRIAAGNVGVALPTAPSFVCPAGATHLMCQCCQDKFPDRREESNQSNIPSVTCSICRLFYCHMYWGCTGNSRCFGCLNKFKDLNFGDKCTNLLILGNPYESSIFKKYLQQKNLTWKDVLNECLRKVDGRHMEYQTLLVTTNNLTKDSILCYSCGMKAFKELAYTYRYSVTREELPAEATTSRPNCYWGRYCRTQFNKPSHAMRYNHVCHQTRF